MYLTKLRIKLTYPVLKGKGPSGDIQGKTIKNIISSEDKLKELEELIKNNGDYMVLYTDHLRNLSKLNEIANMKILDIDDAKCVLNKLRNTYYKLLDQYDLSETIKMHIIFDHYQYYFELAGDTLHKVTDEVTESVHSRYRIFEERHGYVCNKKGSQNHIIKQHKSVIHFNSLNIGDI